MTHREAISPERASRLGRLAHQHVQANLVAIKVGVVLAPVLFCGVGAGLWAIIPAPADAYIGLALAQAGFMLMLFLLWYARRTARRPSTLLRVVVIGWRRFVGRHGQEVWTVTARVEAAYPLSDEGVSDEDVTAQGEERELLLTSPVGFRTVPEGGRALLVCAPTGEVVAVESE